MFTPRSQKGQVMPWVIILMTFGVLVICGFLGYVGTSVLVTGKTTSHTLAYYAADAGATAVIKDLAQGEDALSRDYSVPSLLVNDYEVVIIISVPATTIPGVYQYFDPGAEEGLSSLAGDTHYLFQLNQVEAGSNIRINWAFMPAEGDWELSLYKGGKAKGKPLAQESGSSSPGTLIVDDLRHGGVYTIDFYNKSSFSTTSSSYSSTGGANKTWVYGIAYKDYLITSEAGDVTISVYARQVPGPTNPATKQTIAIESWQAS